MTSIDITDPEIIKNVKLVQDGSSEHRWVAFGYVPKSNNKLKLYDYGPGDLKELREELGDSTIRFAYMRYSINNMPKFVYIAWCGDGVNGPIKGSFSGHAIQFGTHLKPVHHQLNARNEDDLDEKAIIASLTKATGANYDSGAKVQGATKAFVPSSVAQGRESATKSNAEVKNFVNKNDYNKINESAEYWKTQQQQQQQQAPAPAPVAKAAPSRTVANKFQEQALKPAPAPAPVQKPAPAKNVLNRFQPVQSTPVSAPPPSRPSKPAPVVRQPEPEPEPVYEEPQQTYEEPQQTYEEPQQTYEEQQYDQQQYDQQQYDQQQYDQQQYDQQQYEQPQEEQQYDEQQYDQQQYDQQQYEQPQEEQQYDQQQYDQQQYEQPQEEQQYDQQGYNDGYTRVKALYDYVGENEGDLSFKVGDIIIVLDQSDPDGWFQGQLDDGSNGFFPSNFTEFI
ncbi:hypothetical protein DICPUDRAFT_84230 [Dictyostelium purpureum]|uniref:SH3 domain-containing protein n=1 Tax=Dictyostelium purpureum TaxID=5786 RepID=F1A1Z7_DICPU|nr:uncharacterized protein DICPUDRAFT_84230 [Dictyostelium purpureum]EGC29781.1 hypothetical protein DICPUDRAFT_84230 [Dictyostelium purpureum]|eukprot:XP_003293689.1 hypothetical protein DICPUDRAFT_84230 [Dictyostelium purpureum]